MKRVEVSWIDSAGNSGWRDLDDVLREAGNDPLQCWTCGYLLEDNDEYVLVALNRTVHPDGSKTRESVGDTIQIPRVAVSQIRYLR